MGHGGREESVILSHRAPAIRIISGARLRSLTESAHKFTGDRKLMLLDIDYYVSGKYRLSSHDEVRMTDKERCHPRRRGINPALAVEKQLAKRDWYQCKPQTT